MTTKIIDRSIGSYLDALGSKEPTPGGGAVCALTAAQAAALLAMTIGVSGPERWDSAGADGNQLLRRLHEARRRFSELADRDELVFQKLMDAYRLAKGDDLAKARRKRAIQEASLAAAMVPLDVMRLAAALLDGAGLIVTRAKATIVSDAAIAARLLDAALRASSVTIEINAKALEDQAAAGALRAEVAALLAGKESVLEQVLTEAQRVMTT